MSATATAPPPLLRMRGIEKRFGGVRALRGVDFGPRAGEVPAFLGENGAGKSTLMDVLSGVVPPDRGTVELGGKPVAFADPRDAQAAGIATIFQELDLVPGLSVAADLFLGHEPTRLGRLDERHMARDAPALLQTRAGVAPARVPAYRRRPRTGVSRWCHHAFPVLETGPRRGRFAVPPRRARPGPPRRHRATGPPGRTARGPPGHRGPRGRTAPAAPCRHVARRSPVRR